LFNDKKDLSDLTTYFVLFFIGQRYESGTEFCLGQRFEVVGGTTNCFKFDPTVFSQSYHQKPSLLLTLLASFLIGLLVLVQ